MKIFKAFLIVGVIYYSFKCGRVAYDIVWHEMY